VWRDNVESMDRVIRGARMEEAQVTPADAASEDLAAVENRAKSRQSRRAKTDTVSVAIHRQEAKPSSKLWSK